MPPDDSTTRSNRSPSADANELAALINLGPDAQGDVDESLLRDNLRLTPLERLLAASEAATQVELLRAAVQANYNA